MPENTIEGMVADLSPRYSDDRHGQVALVAKLAHKPL
jgi:hypothetical protein